MTLGLILKRISVKGSHLGERGAQGEQASRRLDNTPWRHIPEKTNPECEGP